MISAEWVAKEHDYCQFRVLRYSGVVPEDQARVKALVWAKFELLCCSQFFSERDTTADPIVQRIENVIQQMSRCTRD